MSFLNVTIGQLLGRFRPDKPEPDNFALPKLNPWLGRRERVYPIIAACWRAGIHKYPQIMAQVKLETGTACSRATIAEWKKEFLPGQKPYSKSTPPSPRTGTEKPRKPYKPIFREGVKAEW